VLQAQKETAHFGQRMQQMFGMVRQLMGEKDDKAFVHLFSQIEHQEDLTDRMELEIARFLEQVSQNHLSDDTKTKVRQMLREVGELESIGDACYNLARTINRQREMDKHFIEWQSVHLNVLMNHCDDALTQMNIVMTGHRSEHDIRDTYRIENEINQMRQQMKNDNIRAINDHEYDYSVGTIFTDLVNECEKLGDYVVNVVQARFRK
jgi:phosphate:Na+ symporter